jgi:hypothetical protein
MNEMNVIVIVLIMMVVLYCVIHQEGYQQFEIRYNKFLGSHIPYRERIDIETNVNLNPLKEPDIRSTGFRYIRLH